MKKRYKFTQLLMAMLLSVISLGAYAQDRNIKGVVTDENGEPLPGVSILIKGTTKGTTTNLDGEYSLVVEGDAPTLVFSYIGYLKKEIAVASQTTINIQMDLDQETLEEIVVIGYGTLQKREVTGSIAKVKGADLAAIPTPSFESALQGKASGVQVIQGSGLAGSGSVVRVRGISSISAGAEPLFVVDGIPITNDPFINNDKRGAMNRNPLSTINPNDIESVEILKDAAAVGIYGSRGANGVVIITTKRGKAGKPSFTFTSKFGVTDPVAKPDMLNGSEWLEYAQEAWENDGNIGKVDLTKVKTTYDDALGVDTDWWDLVTRTGVNQDYNFSATIGGEKLQARVSAQYSNAESYFKGNDFTRMSLRGNLDYKLRSNLDVQLSSSLSSGKTSMVSPPWEEGPGASFGYALPIHPVRNADGSYFTNGPNPVRKLDYQDWRVLELRTINSLSLNFRPMKSLSVRAAASIDYMDLSDDLFQDGRLVRGDENTDYLGDATQDNAYATNQNYTLTANFIPEVGSDHSLNFLLGTEFQQSETVRNKTEFKDVGSHVYEDPSVAEGNEVFEFKGKEKWSFLSYFSRVNYTYKDKYIAQVSARIDGSSRFGFNKRYGFFPTVALGWIVSEESFLSNSKIISLLKLKASYGITGNANFDANGRYFTYTQSVTSPTTYGERTQFNLNRLGNPDLQWETSNTLDLGFELGFLEDRITAEFSYYDKKTTDVVMELNSFSSVPAPKTLFLNGAELSNKGIELNINSRNLVGNFKWTTDFNISRNTNRVESIGSFSPDQIVGGTNDTRVIPGESVGANYLVRFSRVDPEDGAPIWLDAEGNETKEFHLDNRVATGHVLPDFVGGITNTFEYKNFRLSALVTFTKGGNIYDSSAKRQLGVVSDWAIRRDRLDRWRQPGDLAQYPRATWDTQTYGSNDIWMNSTAFLYDASFVRLRNVSLSYNLPVSVIEKLNLKSASLTLTGTNLLTFTKYPGTDPEIARDFDNNADRNLSSNITWLTPPQAKTFTFTLNVSF